MQGGERIASFNAVPDYVLGVRGEMERSESKGYCCPSSADVENACVLWQKLRWLRNVAPITAIANASSAVKAAVYVVHVVRRGVVYDWPF